MCKEKKYSWLPQSIILYKYSQACLILYTPKVHILGIPYINTYTLQRILLPMCRVYVSVSIIGYVNKQKNEIHNLILYKYLAQTEPT